MKRLIASIAAMALMGGIAGAAPTHHAFKGQELAGQARVSLATARESALRAHPGQITDQELEKEAGGSGLRYSFDIKSAGKTFEIGVDARTGKVLENAAEGANPD
ncbi:MAG: PepSY domain-containing protein [Caulobacteraceae bacterium]